MCLLFFCDLLRPRRARSAAAFIIVAGLTLVLPCPIIPAMGAEKFYDQEYWTRGKHSAVEWSAPVLRKVMFHLTFLQDVWPNVFAIRLRAVARKPEVCEAEAGAR